MSENEDAGDAVVRIATDWLAQYARFLRKTPELTARLADRPDEFELVPVPRLLLDRLAIPGIMDSGKLGEWGSDLDRIVRLATRPDLPAPMPPEVPPEASGVLDRLVQAAEEGDKAGLAALFSASYLDGAGRDARTIVDLLEDLVETTAWRTVRLDKVRTSYWGSQVRISGSIHWRAGTTRGVELDEEVAFEALLDPAGLIAELRAR